MKLREKYGTNGAVAQASWFVARLFSGEMSGKDEDDLSQWLKADASHRRAYGEVLVLWDVAGELRDDPELKEAAARMVGLQPWRRPARWIAAAAAIAFVAGIATLKTGIFDGWGFGQTLASYETAIGEQRTVTLVDGSRLSLNTNSRVLVDYTPLERRIILDFGEVFFEIEKDLQRLLTVTARGRVLTVLGTSFSVLVAGNDVKVVVVEGVVAVSKEEKRFPLIASDSLSAQGTPGESAPARPEDMPGPNDVIMRAGTIATFRDGYEQVAQAGTEDIERSQSWRSGVVRFDEEPLYAVVGELNRYSPTKILIEDDAIVNLPISGIFRLERVDLILDALEDVLPVKVVRYPDRYVLKGSDQRQSAPPDKETQPSRVDSS